MVNNPIAKLKKLVKNPWHALRVAKAATVGTVYILWYKVFRKNVQVKFPFFVCGPVSIVGPGRISIEKNCWVFRNVFKGLSIITYSSQSEVSIGCDCILGGISIRCREKVKLGDKVMAAYSLVQDHLFMSRQGLHEFRDVDASESILIGNNVWLSGYVVCLPGTCVDDDSVLGTGSVSYNINVPSYSLAHGNPIVGFLSIKRLSGLKQ